MPIAHKAYVHDRRSHGPQVVNRMRPVKHIHHYQPMSDSVIEQPAIDPQGGESDFELPDDWVLATEGPNHSVYLYQKDSNDAGEDVFTLRSHDYYDVQMYVFAGMTLPSSDARFDQTCPSTSVERLNAVDPTAWNSVRRTLVDVQNHCDNFNTNSMSGWTFMTNDVISYAKFAHSQITGKDNLTASLAILCGPEYAARSDGSEPEHDKKYNDAKEVAQSICDDLATRSRKYSAKCDEYINSLQAFLNQTKLDKLAVDELDFKFNKNTNPDGSPRQSLGDLLQKDLSDTRNDEVNQLKIAKDAHEEYDHDVVVAATTPTYAWWFPIGTAIAVGIAAGYTVKALEAKEKYETAEKIYLQDVTKEWQLCAMINWTTHMGSIVADLDTKMDRALEAMKDIKKMFSAQSTAFTSISDDLNSAAGKFDRDWNLRKRLHTKFEECARNWKLVENLAKQFLDTADIKVEGMDKCTAAGAPPPPSS